jgi:hypothetical protein
MKKPFSLAIAMLAFATISFAQHDPNCGRDPHPVNVGAFDLSVTPTTINNNASYQLILTYNGPVNMGTPSSVVTVGPGTTQTGLSLSPWGSDYVVNVPCGASGIGPPPIVVATITVSNTSGVSRTGKHKIISVTNGHSIGVQFANYTVNP